jgi:hypothetical protein
MITTEIYDGQGPGDQLWVYLTTRYIAHKNGYDFGIIGSERWKLTNLDVDFGKEVKGIEHTFKEHRVDHPGFHDCNISDVDKRAYEVSDNTRLDGLFHYAELLKDNSDLFREWLNLDSIIDRNPIVPGKVICNIRGGEYRSVPDLILPKNYWDMALSRLGNPEVEVITDDPGYAQQLIPQATLFNGSMIDHFERLFTADYLVLSNSAFGFFPAALGNAKDVIAPKYWSRWNVSDGFWAMEMDRCDKFTYIDREGNE